MRVLVTGDRKWGRDEMDGMTEEDKVQARSDARLLTEFLQGIYEEQTVGFLVTDLDHFYLIEGGARGADEVAAWWADNSPLHGYPDGGDPRDYDHPVVFHEQYPADWNKNGRAAGPIRNQQMLDTGIDLCIAAHSDLENSKGTGDMVRRCIKAGVPTYNLRRMT